MTYIPSQTPYLPPTSSSNTSGCYLTNQSTGYPMLNPTLPQYHAPQSYAGAQMGILATLVKAFSQLVSVLTSLVQQFLRTPEQTNAMPCPHINVDNVWSGPSQTDHPNLNLSYTKDGGGLAGVLDSLGELLNRSKELVSGIIKKGVGLWKGVKSLFKGVF